MMWLLRVATLGDYSGCLLWITTLAGYSVVATLGVYSRCLVWVAPQLVLQLVLVVGARADASATDVPIVVAAVFSAVCPRQK